MFRRRGSSDGSDETDETGETGEVGADLGAVEAEPAAAPPVRPTGPWDEEDAPDDGVSRLDLGGLLVPVDGGHELRVDVDPESGALVSVTLATPSSLLQVGAFAAPRSAGIWGEVREEIATSLVGSGGSSREVEGPYGTELHAQVPTEVPGQLGLARFVGVDGPRWFLRAMIQGRAAAETDADPVLLLAFGQIVVRRGTDAMAVRDALPLRLPEDTAPPAPPEGPPTYDISLQERGPEITETA